MSKKIPLALKSENRDKIPKQDVPNIYSNKLKLSFVNFDRTHEAFNLGGTKIEWFITLLDMFKEWTSKTWNELKSISTFDVHPKSNGWKYKFSFDKEEQLEQFQIRVSRSKGRVHGFILDGTFYIVWLDPHHNMTDSDHYEKDKFFPAIESLEEENERLRNEIKIYEELFNKTS